MNSKDKAKRMEFVSKLQALVQAAEGPMHVRSTSEDGNFSLEIRFDRQSGGNLEPIKELAALLASASY
jgi:hypothetical protein